MFQESLFPQSRPWENKAPSVFREWLIYEAQRDEAHWSQDFRDYISRKVDIRMTEEGTTKRGISREKHISGLSIPLVLMRIV